MDTTAVQNKSQELIRLLSHHLLLVGQQCVMAPDPQTERNLIDNSHFLWRKNATWSWNDVPKEEQRPCQGIKPFDVTMPRIQKLRKPICLGDHPAHDHSHGQPATQTGTSSSDPNGNLGGELSKPAQNSGESDDVTKNCLGRTDGRKCCQCGSIRRYLI